MLTCASCHSLEVHITQNIRQNQVRSAVGKISIFMSEHINFTCNGKNND